MLKGLAVPGNLEVLKGLAAEGGCWSLESLEMLAAWLPRSPLPVTPPGSRRVLRKPVAHPDSLELPVQPVGKSQVLGG